MQNKFNKNYYYGSIYTNYDDFLDWTKLAREIINKYKFNSFLDVGCGCGNLVKEMRKQKPEIDAWGVDSSEYAVRKAGVNYVIQTECSRLPFVNNYFDITYILTTFSYLPKSNLKKAMQESHRVAKEIILFEDVYTKPKKDSDDYDPYRKRVLPQKQWLALWKEIVGKSDRIQISSDEVIIHKNA